MVAAPSAAPGAEAATPEPPEGHDSTRPSLLGVGVVVWLSSELMFFAGLFAAYFTLRAEAKVWPPPNSELAVFRTGLATLILIGSSFTMHQAVKRADRGDRRGAIRWILITGAMGTIFLANQAWEWIDLSFGLDTNAYGSIYYLLTGFHGLHVFGGLCFMVAVIVMIAGVTSDAPSGPAPTVLGYYWHFVDVVWVVMYLVVYILR